MQRKRELHPLIDNQSVRHPVTTSCHVSNQTQKPVVESQSLKHTPRHHHHQTTFTEQTHDLITPIQSHPLFSVLMNQSFISFRLVLILRNTIQRPCSSSSSWT